MLQFLIGYWCGCVSAVLVICLLYANKKGQLEEAAEKKTTVEAEESVKPGAATEASGPRVLLIDDSKLSRTMMKEYLADKGLEIFEAEDGAESLKLVRKYEFDLIFLDQCMPGMDGDETLYFLRSDGGVSVEVPVVAVGSAIRRDNAEEYRAKGYAACLGKPIQKNRLDEIVTQMLSGPKKGKIPTGFSYQKGLENFDGNEAIYRETLVMFAELWKERREQLLGFLADNNMQEYAILIHAIKGDARTLGAYTLGELAYAQELKAKEGDGEAIKNSMEALLKECETTVAYFIQICS